MKAMMSRLRSATIAAVIASAALAAGTANAQNGPTADDQVLRLFARSEAKHRSSRRNLVEILHSQPHFWIELQAVASRLKTHPAWLLNVMASESLFNPAARNPLPGQSASGLLQFIEATARGMGTTTEAIRRMSAVEQLGLVERYLAPFRGRLNSLADVYLAVFRGFIIDGGDASVVAPLDNSSKERRIFSLNKGLDLDGDGKITKGDLALAALTVGRFQPRAPRPTKGIDRSAANPERKLETRRKTRSIYVRRPQ